MVVTILHIFHQTLPSPAVSALSLEMWWPFTGAFSVAVFFLVSGYSLSVGYLGHGRRDTLCRLVAGRYFRLIIPVFAACALMSLFMNAGLILPAEARPDFLSGVFTFEPTLAHLLRFALFDVLFAYDLTQTYAPPLWTISYEFFGTLLVAAALLALGPPAARLPVWTALVLVLVVFLPWYALFAVGVVAAGLGAGSTRRLPGMAGLALLAAGVGIAAMAEERLGLIVLSSVLFFAGAVTSPGAARFFSNRFSRWLGEISFPIYLLHIPVTFAAGLPIYVRDPDSTVTALAAGCVALAASIVAAVLFIPVNTLAMTVARRFGRAMTTPLARPA